MGYIRHHAILVTGGNLEKVHTKAIKIFGHLVSNVVDAKLNGYCTFFIVAPDGSKEGWKDSEDGNKNRDKFIEILKKNGVQWAEVQFGDEDGYQKVTRASRMNSDDDS